MSKTDKSYSSKMKNNLAHEHISKFIGTTPVADYDLFHCPTCGGIKIGTGGAWNLPFYIECNPRLLER